MDKPAPALLLRGIFAPLLFQVRKGEAGPLTWSDITTSSFLIRLSRGINSFSKSWTWVSQTRLFRHVRQDFCTLPAQGGKNWTPYTFSENWKMALFGTALPMIWVDERGRNKGFKDVVYLFISGLDIPCHLAYFDLLYVGWRRSSSLANFSGLVFFWERVFFCFGCGGFIIGLGSNVKK